MHQHTDGTQTDLLLTRAQTARRIGVSLATVRRMEKSELNPIVIDGKYLFRAEDVDRYANADEGHVAARAFEFFEAGKDQVQVVIAMNLAPEQVTRLHDQWVQMSNRVVMDPPGLGLPRFLRDELGCDVTPVAMLAALRMLYLDEGLRARWSVAVREAMARR